MSDEARNDALDTFEVLKREDPSYARYAGRMGPLAEFLAEYEYQKGVLRLTQKDLASKAGTSQSAISRFEAMKHPPTYDFLVKISKALGDTLFLSPAGSQCVSIPYDLREGVENAARRRDVAVPEYVQGLLKEAVNRETFRVVSNGSSVVTIPDVPRSTTPAARCSIEEVMRTVAPETFCVGDEDGMAV